MAGLNSLLSKVRRTPEPLKQRLRPIYFRMLTVAGSAPGGRRAGRLLADFAPDLHAWLRIRLEAYHVLKLVGPGSPASGTEGERLHLPPDLAATEGSVFRRLASRQVVR